MHLVGRPILITAPTKEFSMHRCKKHNILSPKNTALHERNIYDDRTYGMIRSESFTKLSATGKSFSASIATAASAGSSTATSETSAGGASRVAAEREPTEGALMDAGAKAEVVPAAAAMMKAENFMVESLLKLLK